MAQNFFEVVGMANIERIHSQMWLYFFQDDLLDNSQKSYILNTFFGTEGEYKSFQCYTEYENIDVVITVDNEEKIFAIENKVKISQHSDQLKRYSKILEEKFKGKPLHCVYLSLIGENPFAQNWSPGSYNDLLETLQVVYFKKSKNLQEQIFNEYVNSIKRLIEVFDKFSNHHEDFFQVFLDGNKTKDKKRELIESGSYYQNDDQKYIALNQLETIFQRNFLFRIARAMHMEAYFHSEKFPKAHIDEGNGTAILHIDIQEDSDDKKFVFGIQFQANAVKITYSKKDYHNGFAGELGKSKLAEFEKFGSEKGLRFNPPRTKAYMSLSKKICSDNEQSQMWKKDFNSLLSDYKQSYEAREELILEIRKRFEALTKQEK